MILNKSQIQLISDEFTLWALLHKACGQKFKQNGVIPSGYNYLPSNLYNDLELSWGLFVEITVCTLVFILYLFLPKVAHNPFAFCVGIQ